MSLFVATKFENVTSAVQKSTKTWMEYVSNVLDVTIQIKFESFPELVLSDVLKGFRQNSEVLWNKSTSETHRKPIQTNTQRMYACENAKTSHWLEWNFNPSVLNQYFQVIYQKVQLQALQ